MQFSFKIWKLTITLILLDTDPSDGDLMLGIKISWK